MDVGVLHVADGLFKRINGSLVYPPLVIVRRVDQHEVPVHPAAVNEYLAVVACLVGEGKGSLAEVCLCCRVGAPQVVGDQCMDGTDLGHGEGGGVQDDFSQDVVGGFQGEDVVSGTQGSKIRPGGQGRVLKGVCGVPEGEADRCRILRVRFVLFLKEDLAVLIADSHPHAAQRYFGYDRASEREAALLCHGVFL